jgi:hypothetical protein
VVLDRLGRQAGVALGVQVALDLGGLHPVHRPVAEEGRQMAAQVAAIVGDLVRLRSMTFSRCATYASPASPIVWRWPRATTVVASTSRRSYRSAWVRVSPSALPAVRLSPILRFTRVPPAHQEPYQLARPPRSRTMYRRPVP